MHYVLHILEQKKEFGMFHGNSNKKTSCTADV